MPEVRRCTFKSFTSVVDTSRPLFANIPTQTHNTSYPSNFSMQMRLVSLFTLVSCLGFVIANPIPIVRLCRLPQGIWLINFHQSDRRGVYTQYDVTNIKLVTVRIGR